MGEVIDLQEWKNKNDLCPVCGDGQTQPCFAECFGIDVDED